MALENIYSDVTKSESKKGSLEVAAVEPPVKQSYINSNQDLHYLYQQAPIGIIFSVISALLVSWFVLSSVPDYLYMPWLSFIVLTSFVHSLLIKEFSKHKNALHVNNQWAIYHTFIVATSALAFSLGYLVFLPLLDTFNQVILLLIMATMAVAYLPILSIFLPAYVICISAFIFPMVFWIYSLPTESAYPIAALLVVTYCVLIVVASYYSRALLEAFELAGQINDQIKDLHENIEDTKSLNIKLKKDIYEQSKNTDQVSREKEQAEVTLQSIGEGVISTDEFGRINYMNPVAEIYTGWMAKDAKGKYLNTVIKLVDEASHIKLSNPVDQCIEENVSVYSTDNSLLIRRDGLEYAIEYSTTPIVRDSNNVSGSVMLFRDVTEKRTMERNLNWQAKHDPLTGLINRREFETRLKKVINKSNSSEREHALCYIDLDRFKLVNDSCGHQAGDELLQKIANRLRKITRDTDTLARLGADEFAVIMYSCSLEKAKLIADIFCEEVSKTKFEWHGKQFTVTASIGIVPIDDNAENLTEIQRIADTACYKAKDSGGNRIEIYDPDNADKIEHTGELKLLEELQNNLDKESFKLFTQRIQPLDDLNDVLFHEVLIKMKNSNGELITANHFLHTAEAYHMLPSIDHWVLKVIMEMIAYGNPLFNKSHMISMNLSQQSVLDEKLTNYIIDMFNDYDIPAGNICFEINEPQFHTSNEQFKRFVTLIKRQGCRVALDDFNYNPSSINLVKRLAIDYIKLDARQFGNLNNEQDFNYKLLESINQINHLAGAQTIIKCMDNAEILDTLFEIGTDYIQGYAIEAPQILDNTNNEIKA